MNNSFSIRALDNVDSATKQITLTELSSSSSTEFPVVNTEELNADNANIGQTLRVSNLIVTDTLTAKTQNIPPGGELDLDGETISGVTLTDSSLINTTIGQSGPAAGFFTTLSSSGTASFRGNITLTDNDNLYIGTGNDFGITHNGTNTIMTNSFGHLIIDNIAIDKSIIIRLGTDTDATNFKIQNNIESDMLSVDGSGIVNISGATYITGLLKVSEEVTLENNLTVNGNLNASILGSALDANSQAITNINVESGTIDSVNINNCPIGSGGTSTGSFTTLTSSSTTSTGSLTSDSIISETTLNVSGEVNISGAILVTGNLTLYEDVTLTVPNLSASKLTSVLDANSQIITDINVDSGSIDGTIIGANSAAAGTFTTLTSSSTTSTGSLTSDSIISETTLNVSGEVNISGAILVTGNLTLYEDVTLTVPNLSASKLTSVLDANSQIITDINVDSGSIDGTIIGANSAAAGSFTTLTSNSTTSTGSLTSDSIISETTLNVSGEVNISGAILVTGNLTLYEDVTLTVPNLSASKLTSILDANSQIITDINVDSGSIDGTIIGDNSAAAGTFTTLTSSSTTSTGSLTSDSIISETTLNVSGEVNISGAILVTGNLTLYEDVTLTVPNLSASKLTSILDANSQIITDINVDSGSIDGTIIGANSAAAGTFTTLTSSSTTSTGSLTSDSIISETTLNVSGEVNISGAILVTGNLTLYEDVTLTVPNLSASKLTSILDANSQIITDINVDSGSIDGTIIGANSAAAGTFTTLTSSSTTSTGSLTSDSIISETTLNVSGEVNISGAILVTGNLTLYEDVTLTVPNLSASKLTSILDANSQIITDINVDSGSIDGTIIGANSAAAGTFTTLTANSIQMVDNTISAFTIKEGTNDYIDFITTNDGEKIIFHKDSNFTDSTVLDFGNNADLIIEHNGTDSTMTSKTGDFIIDNTNTTGSSIIRLGTNSIGTNFQVQNNSSTSLFTVDGDGKTTFHGSGNIHINGTQKLYFGSNLNIYQDGSDCYIQGDFGDLYLNNTVGTNSVIAKIGSSNSNSSFNVENSGGNAVFKVLGDGDTFITGDLNTTGEFNITGAINITGNLFVNGSAITGGTSVDINGGTIDGTVIGGDNSAAGTFTTIDTSSNLVVGGTISLNNSTASGSRSIALGVSTLASGNYSIAIGYDTTASGNISTAMGYKTIASGIPSTAMGSETEASGHYSTAMGYQTTASGLYSTTIGYKTTASANHSIAMGKDTTASGESSTSIGINTIASDYGLFVIGQYNDSGSTVTTSATSFSTSNKAFIIGNGTGSSSKSDALVVDFSGNTYIAGATNITEDLNVSGTTRFYGSSNIHIDGTKKLYFGSNLNIYQDDIDCFIQGDFGDLYLKNTVGTKSIIAKTGSSNSTSSFNVENSGGNTVFKVLGDGNTFITGDLNTTGEFNITGTINVTGNLFVNGSVITSGGGGGGGTSLNDGESYTWGTDDDLTIVHSGTEGSITNTTGDFIIDNINTTGSSIIRLGTNAIGTDFQVQNNSSSSLFTVDGDGKTTFHGSGNIHIDGTQKLYFGSNMNIYQDGIDCYIQGDFGDLYLKNTLGTKSVIAKIGSSNSSSSFKIENGGGTTMFEARGDETINIPKGFSYVKSTENITLNRTMNSYDSGGVFYI